MILKGSVTIVASGAALGLCAMLFLARSVEKLLFGVHAFDTVTLLVTPTMLLAISAAAAYGSARRAAELDPLQSLRHE